MSKRLDEGVYLPHRRFYTDWEKKHVLPITLSLESKVVIPFAEKIQNNYLLNWNHLPQCVADFHIKNCKICIILSLQLDSLENITCTQAAKQGKLFLMPVA